ncbi:MAG: hypothetical protein WCN88_00995 [Candidatus Falkowbacteria bacterium]
MNKYEARNGLSRDEQAANSELGKVFREFRDIVLNNKDYELGKAREILSTLNEKDAKKLFELFNHQEGALPDELAIEYIKLVYSSASIGAKMAEGKTYYEALSAIAWEIKNAHLELNTDLVQEQIKLSAAELNQV